MKNFTLNCLVTFYVLLIGLFVPTVFCVLLTLGEGGILNVHFSRLIVRLLHMS